MNNPTWKEFVFGVVLLSLALNVLGTYIVRLLDRWWPRFTIWRRATEDQFDKDAKTAASDLSWMTFLAARHAGHLAEAIILWSTGAGIVGFGLKLSSPFWSAALQILGVIVIGLGAGNWGRAMRCKTTLDGAIRLLSKKKPSPGTGA